MRRYLEDRKASGSNFWELSRWRCSQLAALFLLSLVCSYRIYTGLETSQSSSAVAHRSLREISGRKAGSGWSTDKSKPLNSSSDLDHKARRPCEVPFGDCWDPTRSGHAGAGSTAAADFDWQAYCLYYPELRRQGVRDEASAWAHYQRSGRAEGRVTRRLRVLLRYTAGTGLINQHYSHIAAFTLAAVLGAEVVLPPAMHRSSYEHIFSVFKGKNAVQWSFAPLETLYNVHALIDTWREIGIKVHRTPPGRFQPDLSQPQAAFPSYEQPEVPDRLAARMLNVYGQNLELSELAARAQSTVLDITQEVLRQDPNADIGTVALDLPCTFFMLAASEALPVVTPVARALPWTPAIEALADKVIAGIAAAVGKPVYNGVHLRIEKDAHEWATILGGRHVVEARYRAAMRQAAFEGNTPLYVASALLTYAEGQADLRRVVANLTGEGLASTVVYKEMFLQPSDTRGMHSEQQALLDLIVLAKAARFVGFGPSTYSFFLREYRTLNGVSRDASVLVDGSRIGTDPLFHSAGILNLPNAGEWPPLPPGAPRPHLAEGAAPDLTTAVTKAL